MIRIDLKNAYIPLSIHSPQRTLLFFIWEGMYYQWNFVPFGLGSAPWVYTKIVKPVVALFCTLGFLLVIYTDGILVIYQYP